MDVLREILLPKLDGIRKSGGSYMARCPAHDDGKASLSVSAGKDQPVVLKCLAGETRVMTREGTMTLAEMAGSVHELLVPSIRGGPAVWQKAPVSSFGVQRLMRLTLRRFNTEKVVHATSEHRWFVQKRNGATVREIETKDLESGMRLKAITPRRHIEEISSFGVAHGFTYGDGNLLGRGLGAQASFCGPKDAALLSYFPHMKVHAAREDVLRVTGLPKFFKQMPPIDEAPAYLFGWLAGYFAADGSIEGPDGPAVISSASRESLEFVRDVATRLGIVTYPIQRQFRRVPLPQGGIAESVIYKVTLRPLDLPDEFFILPVHRQRWAERTPCTSYDTWRVVSVEETDRVEEVFCATVDGSHAFALEDNILTGNCHAGCDPVLILDELGLTWDDLCRPREERAPAGEWTPHGEAVAVYDYTDEDGKLLFQVCRTADKQFPQRVPDRTRKTGWRWSLGDARRVLYRLPKVIEAVKDGEVIWIAEGEKDVHALERAGVTATCNPGGAGKWRPEFAEFLRDAVVFIIADKDRPGQAHARQIAATLDGIAAAVEIREAAGAHKDAAAHLAAGLGLSDFAVTYQEGDIPADLAPDLYDFLDVVDPPSSWVIPEILERSDRLIFTGFEGLGKSVITRQLAIAAAAGIHPFTEEPISPQRVLFIDCENPDRKSRRHFRRLEEIARLKGFPVPRGGFRIIQRPAGIDLTREEDAAWLLERVTAHKPDLLVAGPFYRLHAADTNEEQAARTVVAALDAARVKADCALITEAHAGHGEGWNRSIRPIGSSLLMRWPEFGYGIRPATDEADENGYVRHVQVLPWRGPREERHWPRELVWGTHKLDWPWVPAPLIQRPDLRAVPSA